MHKIILPNARRRRGEGRPVVEEKSTFYRTELNSVNNSSS